MISGEDTLSRVGSLVQNHLSNVSLAQNFVLQIKQFRLIISLKFCTCCSTTSYSIVILVVFVLAFVQIKFKGGITST